MKQCIEGGAKKFLCGKTTGLFDNRVEEDDRISVGYVLRFLKLPKL